MISIFAPAGGNALPAWIESPQIVQYARHRQAHGTVLGDRQDDDATGIARSMGWTPPEVPSRFDVPPYLLRDNADRRHLCPLPPTGVQQVAIHHTNHGGLVGMGLKWHAVPLVSNMTMTIGGIDYPCAPFHGVYMSTEIASRNFADTRRYDLLAEVARALDIRTNGAPGDLRRDTALFCIPSRPRGHR